MLTSINPLGERARNQSFAITAAAFVVASTVAAAALGGVLGAIGAPLARRAPVGGVVLIALLAVVGVVLDVRRRVPGPQRQVNEDWLVTYRGWVYGAGFGAELGLAFATIVAASATWVAFACALLTGSWLAGLAIGAVFGLIRALPVFTMARIVDGAALRTRIARLERIRPSVARVLVVLQALAAVALLGTVVS